MLLGKGSRAAFARKMAVASVVLSSILIACNQAKQTTPGQLVIAIETDMALPDQVDTIELEVLVKDTPVFDYPMPVGTGTDVQPIPATLTLVAGDDPTVPATIRVLGSKNGVARTLRQVITTVPPDRSATLWMPVQWLCDGMVQAVGGNDGGLTYQSTCGAGATCRAGQCVDSTVDSTTLTTYASQGVFGGSSAPASKGRTDGSCFDTIACMVSGTVEVPDDQCTVDAPSGGAGINVALRVANDGICDTTGTTCFVPLDDDPTDGWSLQNGRVALPAAVCDKLRTGLVVGVVVSTACATKTQSDPPCGAWSSVTQSPDAAGTPGLDAAVPTAPTLVSSVAPAGATAVVCCPLLADSSLLYTCLCSGSGPVQVVAIDVSSGNTTNVATFTPEHPRAQYAAVLAGGNVYWVDRTASAEAGSVCPIYATSVATGATGSAVAVVDGDVYDSADLLADGTNLYAAVDDLAGLAPTASPIQLARIARSTGAVTPSDTGGALPVYQFTQDATSVYVAVDTDVASGTGFERVSRVVQIAKAGGASTTLAQSTVNIPDESHGGFIGLQSDGTSLFAVFEMTPNADGTVETQVVNVNVSDGAPSVTYDEVVDPTTTSIRLLGAVGGAALVVRNVAAQPDGGVPLSESTVIVLPPNGGAPRIAASFQSDTPLFELQAPAFSPDLFWLNQSGRIFRLPAAAFQ
jgi:hypothetical protein